MKYFVILILLNQLTSTNCPRKTVLQIKEDFTKNCAPCPENCSICYLSADSKPVCAFCEEKYYFNELRKCLPCTENCISCTEGDLNHCRNAVSGYFYNHKTEKIESCEDDSCGTCSEKKVCTSCAEGYFQLSKKESETGVKVKCKACLIDDCLFCSEKNDQVKNSTFYSCSLCKTGFALVSGKCRKCPDNCSYCLEESGECTFCEKDHFLNKKENKCEPVSIQNCFNVNSHGVCEMCENHYYLNEKLECVLCKMRFPNCSFCAGRDKTLTCLSCDIGSHIDPKGNCQKCIPNCNHCNSDSCLSCFSGYFYDNELNSCEKCKLKNCEACRSNDQCEMCRQGYYLNQKTKACTPCKGNCLRCFDETEDCRVCPIGFFTLQQEILSQKKEQNNIFSNLMSLFVGFAMPLGHVKISEMRISTKCVKECPKTFKGNEIEVNLAERKCVAKRGDASTVVLPSIHNTGDILHSISKLKLKYDEEIERIKKTTPQRVSNKTNSECFNNGLLKREIKGDTNSYYICRCVTGYLGDNCQISETLYESTQHKLFEFLDDIEKEFIEHNQHNKKKFLKALIQINKFRLSRPIVGQIVDVIQRFLEKDKELDNRKQLYILYDAILLNLFDLIEEIKKNPVQMINANSELQVEREELYKLIHQIVDMLETSLEDHMYLNSFLESSKSESFVLDTFSFMIAEYKVANYQEKTGFWVRNANIDTSYNVIENNKVLFEFEGNISPKSLKNNVQIMTISAPLFEDKLKVQNIKPISNLLYVKFVNPQKPHEVIYNKDNRIRSMRMEIALNFLPVFDDILEGVQCVAHYFGKNKMSMPGKALKFNEDAKTIECEFSAYFEFRNYYFGVTIPI